MAKDWVRIWAAVVVLSAGQALAATYYVETSGADANNGLSRDQAFRSISQGVAALQAGDTLEVGPGVFHEQVAIEKSGEPDKPITIRARHPGRTFLKGSVAVEGWRPVKGYSFVFAASLGQGTSLAHEADTGAELLEVANLNDLEQTPGGFVYDAEQKTLYVHPTDSAGMDHHVIEASVLDYGFVSQTAKPFWNHTMRRARVSIEGFVVSGYQEGGIMLRNADHCHVRDCVVYHTRAGIFMHGAWNSSITGCVAFRNNDRFMQEMGNIGIMSYSSHCLLENNVVHSTPQYGIRFYGGFYADTMRNNLAWDCATGIHVKGQFGDLDYAQKYLNNLPGKPKAEPGEMLFERNVAHQCLSWSLIPNACVSSRNTGVKALPGRKSDKSDLLLAEADAAAARFADPAYHDLRLQSDSPWVKAGPGGKSLGAFEVADEVLYVGTDGDDGRRGTSVSQAWKTLKRACGALKAGQTLYILPGEYKEPLDLGKLSGERRTFVRAFGKGVVTLDGEDKGPWGLRVADSARLTVEGLQFRGFKEGARLERSQDVEIKECAFFDNAGAAVAVADCEGARVMSSALVFNGGPAVAVTGGLKGLWVAGCVMRDNAGPALALGGLAPDETFFSDFNNVGGAAAEAGGKALSLAEWRKAARQDGNSFDLAPGFFDPAKRDLRLKADSLCRGRGYLGQAAGPGRLAFSAAEGLEFKDVCVQNVTPSTADLSWTSRGRPTTVAVRYGERADKLHHEVIHNTSHFYRTRHVYTLDGLKPNTKYYFKVGERRLLEGGTPYHQHNYSWPELTPAGEAKRYEGLKKEDVFDSATYAFVTSKTAEVSGKAYWVSPGGDDAADGGEASPWKTVGKACAEARPGDRVTLRAGTYAESIRPMRSGLPGRPIVFEAAKGERVALSGKRLLIAAGADLVSRRHIVIRGFFFQEHAQEFVEGGVGAQVLAVDAEDIVVERCVFDGRMNYMYAGYVYRSRDVRFHNNIFMNHHSAIIATDNLGTLELSRNTFLGPTIHKLYGNRNDRVVIRNNLLGENLFPKKELQYKVVAIGNRELEMDFNCYYFDPKNKERRAVDYGTLALDMANVGPLPDGKQKERFGAKGDLKEWQGRYGQDQNSFIADPLWENPDLITKLRDRHRGWPERLKDYPAFNRSDLKVKAGSPCLGKGENGVTIGADTED